MAAERIVVDSRGDLLLCFPGSSSSPSRMLEDPDPMIVTGTETEMAGVNSAEATSIELQVSSSVLSLASPVFSAMLSGPMSEAVAFRAINSPRPFPLTLPEDNGHIFSILARVVHFRADALATLPSTETLLKLASLIDKYDCVPALKAQSEVWLQRAIQEQSDEYASFERRCDLLLFAYVAEIPACFSQLSWDVLLKHRQLVRDECESRFELAFPRDHELLRHDLHGRQPCLLVT